MTVYKIDLNNMEKQEFTPEAGDVFMFVDTYSDRMRITELEAAGRAAVKVLIKAGNQIGASTKFLSANTVFDAADRLEKVLEVSDD